MGRRLLIVVLGLSTVFVSQLTFALGLGNIELKSNLNEPLFAEIELFEVRELDESEILVGLASREDFERVGVDKPYFLSDLKFKVILNGSDKAKIQVVSRKAVREPFLNFIVQVQWPSGKLLREYTLLMDLPVFSDATPQQVQQASVPSYAQSNSQPDYEQVENNTSDSRYNPRSEYSPSGGSSARPSSNSKVQPLQPSALAGDEVRVASNDTLWEIAARARPDRRVTVQQTMLAIQRINPNAFIKNNINLLKEGQVLRIPDLEQIENVGRQSAVAEVAVQNSQWVGGASDYVSGSGPQLEGSKNYNSFEADETGSEGRLTLSSPEEASDSYEGRGTGSGGSSEALENELAITLEQLDKSSKENNELQSKVASLEEQIQTLEKLIEVSNDDLRALELAAQKSKEDAELARSEAEELLDSESDTRADPLAMGLNEQEIADVTVGDSVGDSYENSADTLYEEGSEDLISEDSALEDDESLESSQSEEPVEVEPEVKPNVQKVVIPAPKEPGIIDLLLENIIYLGVLLLAVLVGAAYFIFKKSSPEDEFEDDFLSQPLFEEESNEAEPTEEEETESLESVDGENADQDEEVEEELAEPETEDVVAEADIYIAYGKYDQAEEMLVNALSNEPENGDIRLKLLEVYANQQNVESFDPHMAKLYVMGDQSAISRAVQLREGIADAPDFDESLHDVSDVQGFAADDSDTDDLQDILTSEDELEIDLDTGSVEDLEELSLDLDLGDDGMSPDDEFSLDLDLGDIEKETETTADSSEELELSLDLDVDSESATGEFELNLDDLDLESDSDSGEEITLDIGDLEDTSGEELSLDFALDTEDDDGQQGEEAFELDSELSLESDTLSEELMELEVDSDIEEAIEADDLDLGDLDLGDDLSGLSLDLEDEEDELETVPESLESDLAALDLALDTNFDIEPVEDVTVIKPVTSLEPISLEDDELELDLEELDASEVSTPASEDDTLLSAVSGDLSISPDEDNLDLGSDDDLDLSALDEELDALTNDLDSELAGIEAELEGLDDDLDLQEPTLELADEVPPSPTVMEEPELDFGDLDEELELESEPVELLTEEPVALEETVDDMGEDTMFHQAMSEVPESDLDFEIPDVDPESSVDDEDLGFLSDSDEVATKLDLARAYIDMDDIEGARDIIGEIMKEGNAQQKQEAENLVARLDG